MRKLLILLTGLGLATSTLTTTRIFAPSRDTATTGPIDVRSASVAARSVDLQLATYDGSACGTYSDNLTASIDVSVGLPAVGSSERPGNTRLGRFCLRNVGNVAAAVTISSLVDSSTEIDCTGDEATDDTTCAAGLEGELHTRTQWLGYSVPMGTPWGGGSWGGSRSFGTLTPGAEAIFGLDLAWPSESNHIGAQSDQLLTHFVFDGAVA